MTLGAPSKVGLTFEAFDALEHDIGEGFGRAEQRGRNTASCPWSKPPLYEALSTGLRGLFVRFLCHRLTSFFVRFDDNRPGLLRGTRTFLAANPSRHDDQMLPTNQLNALAPSRSRPSRAKNRPNADGCG